jgi:hypothetical protein
MTDRSRRRAARAPLPLLIGFALFVAALAYMVVASLARRSAPVFAPTAATRARSAGWRQAGDTLTLDATDGARWRFASLAAGRSLEGAADGRWELAARRYRITVAGSVADLGVTPFETARVVPPARFVASRPGEVGNEALRHWYRYSLVTHLLEPDGRVYALRTRTGDLWKFQIIGYYCPGLVPGCVTLRYAPLGAQSQASSADGPAREGTVAPIMHRRNPPAGSSTTHAFTIRYTMPLALNTYSSPIESSPNDSTCPTFGTAQVRDANVPPRLPLRLATKPLQ